MDWATAQRAARVLRSGPTGWLAFAFFAAVRRALAFAAFSALACSGAWAAAAVLSRARRS
jgi:hypothetical protein